MKFSVIIPLYNKAPYIRKALESVLSQTYTDFELIVVDDGSTDGSAEIAEAFLLASRLSPLAFRLIRQANAGVAAARNNGVAQANGDYLAFLDADDWWKPNYLERMAQLIEDYPDAGLYASNYVYYKPGKTHVALNILTGYINYPKAYYESEAMPVWTGATIIPKVVFDEMGGFPVGIKLGEDFLLWAKIALQYKVAFLNEALVWYNNDVPVNLRATRNLHHPNNHVLFRMELAFGDGKIVNQQHQRTAKQIVRAQRDKNLISTTFRANQPPCTAKEINLPTTEDWKRLIDKLRVNGLLEYWVSDDYHDLAGQELAKVDWSKQSASVKRIYNTPIWMLKVKRVVMKWGSWWKQIIYRLDVEGMDYGKKVIIDSRSNYSYGSFYVYGLINSFGNKNVIYRLKPFQELKDLENDLRFIIRIGNKETKYFIHTNDSYRLSIDDYNWCDVYGCVNANFMHYPKDEYPKLVSLVPSFGIRQDTSLFKVLADSCVQLFFCWSYVLKRKEWNKNLKREQCNKFQNLKHYFGRRYKAWNNRLPLSFYENKTVSKNDYIFFLSTLWYNDEWNKNDQGVNLRRAHFIRACKKILGDTFEGGLLGDADSSNDTFEDVLITKRETFVSWIEKTKQSALVFNTPAFWDCHGWKLGEYLAMGKCIISTPLSNDLPCPLEHGVNIHFVENTEESMAEAISYILSHPEYKYKLEQGAKKYWDTYGTPEASLKLLGIE